MSWIFKTGNWLLSQSQQCYYQAIVLAYMYIQVIIMKGQSIYMYRMSIMETIVGRCGQEANVQ